MINGKVEVEVDIIIYDVIYMCVDIFRDLSINSILVYLNSTIGYGTITNNKVYTKDPQSDQPKLHDVRTPITSRCTLLSIIQVDLPYPWKQAAQKRIPPVWFVVRVYDQTYAQVDVSRLRVDLGLCPDTDQGVERVSVWTVVSQSDVRVRLYGSN